MEHQPVRRVVAFAITLSAVASIVIELRSLSRLRIAWSDVPGWMAGSEPDAIAAALLAHLAVLACAALSIAVIGDLLRVLAGLGSWARNAASVWAPAARSLANRVAVGTLALSSLTPQFAAAAPSPPIAGTTEPLDRSVVPGFLPFSTTVAPTWTATSAVLVQPGDTLWTIAASHLQASQGREPSAAEISRHWRAVIDLNTERLRSADPDLIHPGEEILLPAANG